MLLERFFLLCAVFRPLPEQHSGSLNNWRESVAFAINDIHKWLDFLEFSDKDKKP